MQLLAGIYRRVEDMWWRQALPPFWLRCMSPLYGCMSRYHLKRREANAHTPPLPLVSVGNITAGGSGKTPFVIWLVKALQGLGYSPVVLCRGDGGSLQEPFVMTGGDDPGVVGDEAKLLHENCDCPIIVARDRIAGSRMSAELGDVLILDDGFQYRQLQRNCDIVLVPSEGAGNGYLLPAGPLREPLTSLSRANIIVRSGRDTTKPLGFGREWHWHADAAGLHQVCGPESLQPSRVLAVCGIARPWRFIASLQQSGIEVADSIFFSDHHRYSRSDVATMQAAALPVAVTAKDAVKLQLLWPPSEPLWVLHQEGLSEQGLLDAIVAHMLAPASPASR